jgi:hypothetical protein
MYHGDSFNDTHWVDVSGNGWHVAPSKGSVKANSERRGGVVDIDYVYGTTADGFRFPTAFAYNNWTMFHITRCVGAALRAAIMLWSCSCCCCCCCLILAPRSAAHRRS